MAIAEVDVDKILDTRLKTLNMCFQCGACSGICPFGYTHAFNPRQLILLSLLDREPTLASEKIWICSSCNACVDRCPMEVKPPEAFASLRARAVEHGSVPEHVAKTLFLALKGTTRHGNPWGKSKNERTRWAAGLDVKRASEGVDVLYQVGCGASFDSRAQKIAKAMAHVFRRAGVNFGILGEEENCCGSCVRRMGEEGLYHFLSETNVELWRKYNVKKVVMGSPHCYNVVKNEYAERPVEVMHYVQFLSELVNDGKLTFVKEPKITVTYHDPCFLGRHNGIYDVPRAVLEAMPGVTVVEMRNNKEKSTCCGGGGGRMWVEPMEEVRMQLADIRAKEAVGTGADMLITACQFCMINLLEGVKDMGADLPVKDLVMLVSERLVMR